MFRGSYAPSRLVPGATLWHGCCHLPDVCRKGATWLITFFHL